MKPSLTVYLIFAVCSSISAQNSFSVGAKIGYGTSAFPMKAILYMDGVAHPAKSGATLSTGIIGRYMISDMIGIESGACVNHYSFYKDNNFRTREIYWKTAADLEVLNYQLPILLNYKFKLPQRPFTYLLISGGTTIDWFFPDLLTGRSASFKPRAFQNLVGTIKRGREKMRGKIELGLEIQYSFKHFAFSNVGYGTSEIQVYSKLNMVAINISYFFLNKERRTTES